jgi:tripartite-type tricarboxylate transporter receptor subunit TctC
MGNARAVASIVMTGLTILAAGSAVSQGYPTRPIRLVTAPIGGGNDFVARMVAQALSPRLGQQVVVDNRATTVVPTGGQSGARWLFAGNRRRSLWLAPFLQESVSYDR